MNTQTIKNKSKKLRTVGKTRKTKKIFQTRTNNAIENIKLIKKNNPNYQKCFLGEYINLKKNENNYKRYYKNYESNQQISSYVNIALKYNPDLLSRLMNLSLKRFNPALYIEVFNNLLSNKSDDIIYKNLKKLYFSSRNKYKAISIRPCNKNTIITETLLRHIKDKRITIPNDENYLDIGTGSGKFAINFGKTIGLSKDRIYGVDLENFAEQKDWNRDVDNQQFIFKSIKENQPYPFPDNFFNIITIKMVLHHIKDIDFVFREITRILKKDGILIILEHDSFTYADYMLNDIEHGFYMNVFDENSPIEEYSKTKNKLGYVKYNDWIELDNLVNKYNLEYVNAEVFSESITYSVTPSRTFWVIYKLNK